MESTCPKCRHVRQPGDTAPDWQCPSCGVAYAKVARAAQPQQVGRPFVYSAAHAPKRSAMPWGTLVLVLLVLGAAWAGWRWASHHLPSDGGLSQQQLHQLAANVKPGEVVMYSTTECAYCGRAKSWLAQNGFAFTECNMSMSRECERQFLSYGANGTPYLVVRGQHMKDGFDSDAFLALLQQ